MNTQKDVITSLQNDYQIKRSNNYILHNFDLERLIGNMKHDKKWKNGEMNKMILIRSPIKEVLLVMLHENTEVISHQVNDSIAFQVIEGKLNLHFLNESVTLISGELMKLNAKTGYRIDSIDESSFLMTLSY
jgi:hypothetical protein